MCCYSCSQGSLPSSPPSLRQTVHWSVYTKNKCWWEEMKEVRKGNCNMVLFLKRWDVAFLLWLPSAGLTVGKAFCALSFSVSSLCPSLVWTFVVFIEFSRRWFRTELLAMVVSVLETLCYSPCVWLLWSQELCGAATVSLEQMPVSDMKLWTFNCFLFVFRSRPSAGPGLWGGTLAELQREQPCQPLPALLFDFSLCSCLSLFLNAKAWVKQRGKSLSYLGSDD